MQPTPPWENGSWGASRWGEGRGRGYGPNPLPGRKQENGRKPVGEGRGRGAHHLSPKGVLTRATVCGNTPQSTCIFVGVFGGSAGFSEMCIFATVVFAGVCQKAFSPCGDAGGRFLPHGPADTAFTPLGQIPAGSGGLAENPAKIQPTPLRENGSWGASRWGGRGGGGKLPPCDLSEEAGPKSPQGRG